MWSTSLATLLTYSMRGVTLVSAKGTRNYQPYEPYKIQMLIFLVEKTQDPTHCRVVALKSPTIMSVSRGGHWSVAELRVA